MPGSSPLARGTQLPEHRLRHPDRFIPARAGNTPSPGPPGASATVHPRSRGEHTRRRTMHLTTNGSSPLARGTPLARVGRVAVRRFIPARAGNTRSSATPASRTTVHPRSRGEHSHASVTNSILVGSSPLARGTPRARGARRRSRRFIPARAGNTAPAISAKTGAAVHPRSRGEHEARGCRWFTPTGSSPLARGTLLEPALGEHRRRFIPRSRGEHAGGGPFFAIGVGSSPLARGTRGQWRCRRRWSRFIPARAGNTAWASPPCVSRPVHPRSRGEHGGGVRHVSTRPGSSPLARGTPADGAVVLHVGRFIPARAGNTAGGALRARSAPVHPRSRGEHNNLSFLD